MLTVSLVEDDEDYRELLSRSIRSFKHIRLLSAYTTAEAALTQLPHEQPDVALVGVKLPGLDGIECVRRLRAIRPELPTQFLVLTGYEVDHLIFDALKAGAQGYLWKGRTSSRQLLTAIKDVFGGGAPMTPGVARKVVASFARHPAPLTGLSKREGEVLRRLAEDLTYKEIADQLSISMSTLRSHVVSIYHKLHVHSRIGASQYLQGQSEPRRGHSTQSRIT